MLENVRHIVLTVTRDCNLNCAYCFEKDKNLYHGEKMTLACFQQLLQRLIQDFQKKPINSDPRVEICFHGGEPALVNISTLQSFIDEARKQFSENQIRFSMQTNGTLLNEQWQEFAKKNNVPLSISLDGFNYRSNQFRFINKKDFKKKNPLHKKATVVGVLALLTRNNLSHLVPYMFYLWLKFRISQIRANIAEFVFGESESTQELTGSILFQRGFVPFLRLKSSFPFFNEYNICSALDRFCINYLYSPVCLPPDNESSICNIKFCGTGNTIVNLLPDGTVWSCQRSLGLPSYKLGNIYDPLPDLFGVVSFQKLLELARPMAKSIREKGCDLCFASDICDYGCRAFGLLKTHGISTIRDTLVCDAYKPLKKHLLKDVYNHIVLFALQNKLYIQQDNDNIKICLPTNYNDHFFLKKQQNPNIKIFRQDGQTGICIPKVKLNKRNLFWIYLTIFHQKRSKQ